jgi:RNA polymerase sigma-70 factor, ECF subfamily
MDTLDEARWARLAALLQPIHAQAVVTARRLCRSSFEGDDLFQDTVLRAFEKLHTLRDASRFRPWFYATLLSRHRTRRRRPFWRRLLPWEDVFSEGREPACEGADDLGEQAGRAARMRRALESLPAVQHQAIVLFELDGFSIEEVAMAQQVSVSAVKSRLARGRERLRTWYVRHGFGAPEASGSAAPPALVAGRREPVT